MNLRIIVFFIIGLVIFLLDISLNSQEDSKDIYISDQELTSLLSAWQSQVGRPPSDEEIVNIINNLVQEEILYREIIPSQTPNFTDVTVSQTPNWNDIAA